MNVKITFEEIYFKHFLYSVHIPKSSDIKYKFFDYRKLSGMPVALEVKSNKIIITSPLGFAGKIIYYFILIWSAFTIKAFASPSPTLIYYIKDIEPFLNELQEKGYDVSIPKKQLQEIKGGITDKYKYI